MMLNRQRLWYYGGVAVLVLGGLGWPQTAEAGINVAVKAQVTPPVQAAPGVAPAQANATAKLSPDLQAAVAANAAFLGTTDTGDAVLDVTDAVTLEAAQEALANAPGVAGVEAVVEDRFNKINELLVISGAAEGLQEVEFEGLNVVNRHATGQFVVVRSEDGFSAEEIQRLAGNDAVRYVEPNYQYRLVETKPPDDTRFLNDELWGMKNINAKAAWAKVNSSPVTVAVIDTGINYDHEDLKDNMWKNPGETGGGKETNGIDDDGDGFKDNVYGADFVNNDGDPKDGQSHGSHCAGTIAAMGNNGKGVVGVNWKLKLMAMQIFGSSDSFAGADQVARAIDLAVAKGAKVQSHSWGGPNFSVVIRDAITRAQSKGVLLVVAAANNGTNNDTMPFYPASYTNANIISVLAIGQNDMKAGFSNFGRVSVDLGAPGVGIVSTVLGNNYAPKNGTSMACPHVTGAAALVWGHPNFKNATHSQVKKLLLTNARPVSDLSGRCVTGGTLNLKFLGAALNEVAGAPSEAGSEGDRGGYEGGAKRRGQGARGR